MNSAAAPARIPEIPPESTSATFQTAPARPAVLVATVDPQIRKEIGELLAKYALDTIWAKSIQEVRSLLAKQSIAACFCGFWLVDGTYRDVMRQLKNLSTEIPVVIVCPPACPQEYMDYFTALKIHAVNVISHPYGRSEVEQVLPLAVRTPSSEQVQEAAGPLSTRRAVSSAAA